ncbi:MAG: trehalose-phosphatase, partial [Syntrophomonadaceae bacterium]|nr:trehalose-phosphatase [Syntrophomonadaceae bacterium]
PLEGLILAGLHGAVIKHPGEPARLLVPEDEEKLLQSMFEEISTIFLSSGLPPGFWVENKGISLAVHFREAPDHQVEEGRRRVLQALEPYLERGRLELLVGEKVLELRPTGVNKGQAVKLLTGRYPHHYPIYVGDDFTDEDAFRALGDRGFTIRVTGINRATAACWRLKEPEEVLIFLKNLPYLWTPRGVSAQSFLAHKLR